MQKVGLIAVTAALLCAPLSGEAQTPRAFLDQYCVGCHNQTSKTAGLMLDQLDVSRVGLKAEIWEKVVRKLRAGMMPPAGARPCASSSGTYTPPVPGMTRVKMRFFRNNLNGCSYLLRRDVSYRW